MNLNNMEQPLVSVTVITYNSSKTVLETLESIKAQTYQNIELIVSDDCSTDNTVEICRKWIGQNKSRFVRTELLSVEKNTGVAGNCNRAEVACQGEWVKGIAGDDILMPTCVQDCMDYVTEHPETEVLFGRVRSFGGKTEEDNRKWDSWFNYKLLSFPPEKMLHYLLFVANGLPAPALFSKRGLNEKYNLKNDERIPLLEDWVNWINMLRTGIKFHFLDKDIVLYRLNGGLSTGVRSSLKYFESERLFKFYYAYPAWQQQDPEYAVKRIVEEECDIYKQLLEAESEEASEIHQQRDEYKKLYERYYREYNQIARSKAYRFGKSLLKPLSVIKRILCHH